jgi:hypothetical protein
MDKLNYWRKYLLLTSYFMMAIGIYVAFFKNTALFTPFKRLIDPVFWPDNIMSEGTQQFKGFIYSFSGVFVLLWGLNSYFIIKNAFEPKNKWAWDCIVITTLVWFVIMFCFSIYYKVYYNAVFDVIYFVALLVPIIKTRKYFI